MLIVGAGPAGLAAAARLKTQGIDRVLVIDREKEPGGIPRHCFHTGFGLLDLKRMLSGPRYSKILLGQARDAGAEIQSECTATGWQTRPDSLVVDVTSLAGRQSIDARAVLLATGCRERPRAARLVPGARPEGIYTTGALQQCVYLRHQQPGTTAVVIGAEHVSYSAVMTLNHAGVNVAAMVTHYSGSQTYAPAHWWIAGRRQIPLYANASVTRILGKDRVTGIEIETGGNRRTIECDCVVFTGDWIPDHEFCRTGGVELNRSTQGPDVDTGLRTLTPGVFAAGNLLRGAETADVAALEGRHAAESIAGFLSSGSWPVANEGLQIEAVDPIQWVSPNRLVVNGTQPPRNCFTFRVSTFLGQGQVIVSQGQTQLTTQRFRRLIPNRWYTMKAGAWITQPTGQIPLEFQYE